jgi:hypothetical protein
LEVYNRERGDFYELRFGIGIHSGSLILGTVGSTDHFQCGVVGDSVNLASRVEALTKFFNAVLLLSGPAYEGLPEGRRQRYRHLGRVQVPGRAEIIDVYDCLDAYPAQHQQALLAGIGAFQAAMGAYQAGKWSVAERAFETCRQYWAKDLVHAALAGYASAPQGRVLGRRGAALKGLIAAAFAVACWLRGLDRRSAMAKTAPGVVLEQASMVPAP